MEIASYKLVNVGVINIQGSSKNDLQELTLFVCLEQ